MKIKTTQKKYFTIDERDFKKISQFRWYAVFDGYNWYVATTIRVGNKRRLLKIHTLIMNTPRGMEVDHKDNNGLNNSRSNLRVCTHQKNCLNRRNRKDNSSGFKGVSWSIRNKKWVARIQVNGKRFNLGYFNSKEKANEIYIKNSKKYHKEYSKV